MHRGNNAQFPYVMELTYNFHRLDREFGGAVPGDDDHRDAGVDGAEPVVRLQAGCVREADVENHHVRALARHRFNGLRRGGRGPQEQDWVKRIDLDGKVTGVYADYHYVGTGDIGGAVNEQSGYGNSYGD